MYHATKMAMQHLESYSSITKSGNMYDAPDNQVVYLPCILHFMQTKPHIILSRDASFTLRNYDLLVFFTDDMYVQIDLFNLFFNAPRTSRCC